MEGLGKLGSRMCGAGESMYIQHAEETGREQNMPRKGFGAFITDRFACLDDAGRGL